MSKEEFIERYSELEKESRKIYKLQEDLKNEYINKSKEFEIGDRVKYDFGGCGFEYGFIVGIRVHFNEIRYVINKSKKDGTQSAHNLVSYGVSTKMIKVE